MAKHIHIWVEAGRQLGKTKDADGPAPPGWGRCAYCRTTAKGACSCPNCGAPRTKKEPQ